MERSKRKIIHLCLIAILFLFISLLVISSKVRVQAYDGNKVYFKNLTVDANDSALVVAELFVVGEAGDKVSVKYHTVGVTAIQDLDYTGISNSIDIVIGDAGEATYKISIKCLTSAENRSKFKIVDDDKSYGRYFNIIIDSATNATVDTERNICKCFLPYSHLISANTGKFDENGYDVSYISDLNDMEYRFTDGSTSIEKGKPWKTWEAGVSFVNERTERWVNAFINEGIASAYTSFVIKDLDDNEFFSTDDIYTYAGNRETMEKFVDHESCPGLYMYLATEPCSNEIDWFSVRARGYELGLEAMNLIAQNKNPYDEDDEWVDMQFVHFYSEKRKVYWFNTSGTWYAGDGAFINTTFYKVEPYNGILDVGLAVRNNDGDQDREAKRIWQFLKLVDNTAPTIIGEYVDDSELKETGKLKFYIRFNEPVFSSKWNKEPGSSLEVTFNNGTNKYYATYVAGNYTDTLVYELTNVPKTNLTIVKYQLPNKDIGDMAINRDNYKRIINNKLSDEITNSTRTMTILSGSVNYLTPSLTIDINSSNQPKNIYNLMLSINDNGEKDMSEGTVYYEWSLNSTKENHNDPSSYNKVHNLAKEEGGSFGLTLVKNEADGITNGTYYLHVLGESKYGLSDSKTFGPYVLDGDPPVVEQKTPSINDLKTKEYELVVNDKENGTAISNVYIVFKYKDELGVTHEGSRKIYENDSIINDVRKFARYSYNAETHQTTFYYKSNISPDVLDDHGDPLLDEFLLGLIGTSPRVNFDVTFTVEDKAGNKTTSNIIKSVFDQRDLFKIKLTIPLTSALETDGFTPINDINVSYSAYDYSTVQNNKEIVIEILDETEGGTLPGSNYRDFLVDGTKFSLLVNGKTYEADGTDGDLKYRVTLKDLPSGFYDIIPKIYGTSTIDDTLVDVVATGVSFYLSNNKQDMTLNYKESKSNLVLNNKTFQLQDVRFYYLDQSGTNILNHSYGAKYDETLSRYEGGASTPTFSNINEAKKYIRFMEYQDLYLVKISSAIATLLNSGSASVTHVKAQGETMSAQEGQLWIRYKKNTWNSNSNAFSWAYYYYGNGSLEDGININNLSTNLNNAITEVVNRITTSGEIVYLVEEEYLNRQTNAPYLPSEYMHIEEEQATTTKLGSTFVTPITYLGDNDLYKNNITINNISYPLGTNMPIKITPSTRLFYKYAGVGDWIELKTEEDKMLSRLLNNDASGFYLFREYDDNGISEFSIYFDKILPELDVLVGDTEMVLDGQVPSFSNTSFTIKGFVNEFDEYAYVAIYSYPNRKLMNVLYAADIQSENVNGYVLTNGNYYVQVGDRSGNVTTYTVLLSNSSLEVEAEVNESQTGMIIRVLNREESEIYSYEVYLNEILLSTDFVSTKVYKDPGIYRVLVTDIYGNTVSKIAEYQFKAPQINWYYLNNEDTYSKYDPNRIVNMIISEDKSSSRISNVYTSRQLRLSFVSNYGDDTIKFEILDLDKNDYSYQESNNTITINVLAGFRLRVWYEKYPENDHMYVVRIDTEAPNINSTFLGTSFSHYVVKDENGKVIVASSFDLVDLTNYTEGDYVNLDSLAYVLGQTEKIDFYSGNVINGSHIVLSLSDSSGLKSHTVTRNGQPVAMDLNDDNELIIYSYGEYVITATDMLGNVSKLTFINTNESITTAMVDDTYLVEGERTYGNDSTKLNIYYPGESRIIVKGESGTYTYVINYDGKIITYGRYVVSTENVQNEETSEIEVIKRAVYQENVGFSFDTTNSGIREGTWYPFISENNHTISLTVINGKPVVKVSCIEEEIDVELSYSVGNNVFPSHYLSTLSKEIPTLTIMTGDQEATIKEDSKYIYVADAVSIANNINENITRIEYGYSNTPEINKLTTIYENGAFTSEFVGEEDGFFKILVTNKFNNQVEYLIVKVASFESIVNVTYLDGSKRMFMSNENTIYSNSAINLDVYSDNISFEVNGEMFSGLYSSGVTTLELYKQGTYTVKVISANGIFENFNFVIGTDYEFVYQEEWITGYNEEALLHEQGYTNTYLSINPPLDVQYIEYELNDNERVVLYDNLSEEKIIDLNALKDAIGKDGVGVYQVYFKNKYGDVAKKTIHYSNVPELKLSRKTIDNQSTFEAYDLNKALTSNFYSNYILRFSTDSLRYEFTIDGNVVSLEDAKTIEFSNVSGNGSFGYRITYLDEYGNYIEFLAELYRTEVIIDTSEMNEIIYNNNRYTKDNIIITFDDNLKGLVSINGLEYKEYISGTKFYKDGKYDFIVEDIAGNRNKYSITHKSVNQYLLTDKTGQPIIIGGVINDSIVSFTALDDSRIKSVFKNGKKVEDYNTNTFNTSGHWEVLIEDFIGNEAYAGFYVINNPLVEFNYRAPFDYQITEVWYTNREGHRELLDLKGDSVSLTNNGDYALVVVGKESTTSFNFVVTIDNSIPEATLEGVSDGGITARNVTLKGLKSGDTVEVYKDGVLLSSTEISMSADAPEIETGGDYRIVVTSVSGASVEYNFTRKKIANAATSVFIIITSLVAVAGIGIGLIYHTKLRTDENK